MDMLRRVGSPSEDLAVGTILVPLIPHLSLYADYCKTYDAAAAAVVALRDKNRKFEKFLERSGANALLSTYDCQLT
jgi:hypothetical protein